MKKMVVSLLMALSMAPSVIADEYMKVSDKLAITEDYQRCYQIKKGYSRKDNSPWENFCGKIKNFHYEEGYEYTILVDKYDPSASEITVVKTLARDNSFYYKRLKAKKDSIAKARAAKAAAEGKTEPVKPAKKGKK
ncbi:MAG: DUF4377 domain-containing protein [Paludibacteraceae bacterium]|nr:DUF4377 domain-containing protein [Candidatus Physcocola equi]MCQ2234961.1 DUF4377 domain-containing protein [Paludibacteraceae bacterium]